MRNQQQSTAQRFSSTLRILSVVLRVHAALLMRSLRRGALRIKSCWTEPRTLSPMDTESANASHYRLVASPVKQFFRFPFVLSPLLDLLRHANFQPKSASARTPDARARSSLFSAM
jgi:hypothetical protein